MQNTAPYNTDVPEFQPSREAPIYPSIVRRYPCQEDAVFPDDNVGFRHLTWKIQQPDSSMVWTSVKLVMPMRIETRNAALDVVDTRVGKRLPACNIALSESVMRVFRDTTLTLNGKVFNEVNYYRDILDTCYRGVGPQSYGDNHSLKPVVTRAIVANDPQQIVRVRAVDGSETANYVMVDDIRNYVTSNNESLLDNNGPFLERARLWQDNIDPDSGNIWQGNVSSYLEIGPFQARARKGNTAVPFIKDFHLKLNFNQNESRYDQLRKMIFADFDYADVQTIIRGRVLAPYLLEYGTVANMSVDGESILATKNYLGYIGCSFTAKPYLEVTYTKFLDSMRSSYLLRCYERQYQQSLPRFKLPPTPYPGPNNAMNMRKYTARVTTRLNSYPTKIYLYAEVADEWKGSFLMGGVRRSCQLNNIHCRINQRPDVIYNPSQEECFETFQRHTNSSLEYGAWRKAPIYVFTPADLRQSDMYANDARITWMEWDAECSLTQLENHEQLTALGTQAITAAGYIREERDEIPTFGQTMQHWGVMGEPVECRLDPRVASLAHNAPSVSLQLVSPRTSNSLVGSRINFPNSDHAVIGKNLSCMNYTNQFTGVLREVPADQAMDFVMTTSTSKTRRFDGYIWALVKTTGDAVGEFVTGAWYFPYTFRFVPDASQNGGNQPGMLNDWDDVTITHDAGNNAYAFKCIDMTQIDFAKGVFRDSDAGAMDGKQIGTPVGGGGYTNVHPGKVAFKIDPQGLRNADTTYKANGPTATQTYPMMGPTEFKAAGALTNNNNSYGVNETISTGASEGDPRWVCFVPNQTLIDNYLKFRVTTHTTVADPTTPIEFHYNDTVLHPWGVERVFMAGAAQTAVIDQTFTTDILTRQNPSNQFGERDGHRVGKMVIDPLYSERDIEWEYQLKALYEYGNCQYEFTEQGLPTRVIDNLVPVGPSPGIPSF